MRGHGAHHALRGRRAASAVRRLCRRPARRSDRGPVRRPSRTSRDVRGCHPEADAGDGSSIGTLTRWNARRCPCASTQLGVAAARDRTRGCSTRVLATVFLVARAGRPLRGDRRRRRRLPRSRRAVGAAVARRRACRSTSAGARRSPCCSISELCVVVADRPASTRRAPRRRVLLVGVVHRRRRGARCGTA